MDQVLEKDLKTFRELLLAVTDQGHSWLDRLDKIAPSLTRNKLQQQLGVGPDVSGARNLDQHGLGGLGALQEFKQRFEPLMVGSTGPRYWGFVTGGATPAAVMGDWLAAVYDQNSQTLDGPGDFSASVELETIRLLLQLFNLPEDFQGGFVTGATMSNFTCLAVARQWAGHELGRDIAREGLRQAPAVLAATPHSSAIKSLAMLGIGSANIVQVKTLPGNREAIDVNALAAAAEQLQGAPFILISSGGTVNTVDFDDMKAISQLRKKYRFWWHIDAAFGAFAALSPEHAGLLEGWEQADSITIDSHKWLNVPYENGFFLIKEKHRDLQTATFQNTNAPYLEGQPQAFNYLNQLPENSRRFKSLPVWFTLLAYGKSGYQSIVANNIRMASMFGAYIAKSDAFQLLAPVRLNTVCFTLKERDANIPAFLNRLHESGKVFMTPTTFKGTAGIRAAFVNWRSSLNDVEDVIRVMESSLG